MAKRKSQRCTAIAGDGKQCTHWSRVNRSPIVCHQHWLQSQGLPPATPVNTPRKPVGPDDDLSLVLFREINSRTPDMDKVRIVEAIQKQREREAPKTTDENHVDYDVLQRHMTRDQWDAWCGALDVQTDIENTVRLYIQAGGAAIKKFPSEEDVPVGSLSDPLLTLVKPQPEPEQESDDVVHHEYAVEPEPPDPVPTNFDQRQALHIMRQTDSQKNYTVALGMQGLNDLPDDWKIWRRLR